MNEDEKLELDVEALFPAAAKRVKILKLLQENWASVVSYALVRHSWPYNLGVNYIFVAADSNQAGGMLKNMKGNILRALKRYGYESEGEFTLTITERDT